MYTATGMGRGSVTEGRVAWHPSQRQGPTQEDVRDPQQGGGQPGPLQGQAPPGTRCTQILTQVHPFAYLYMRSTCMLPHAPPHACGTLRPRGSVQH